MLLVPVGPFKLKSGFRFVGSRAGFFDTSDLGSGSKCRMSVRLGCEESLTVQPPQTLDYHNIDDCDSRRFGLCLRFHLVRSTPGDLSSLSLDDRNSECWQRSLQHRTCGGHLPALSWHWNSSMVHLWHLRRPGEELPY
jgi:hypothetical protein